MRGEKEGAAKKSSQFIPVAVSLLALISLLALLLAGFGTRLGLWQFRTGFTVLRVGAYLGLATAVGAVFTIYLSARKRRGGGILLSVLALGCAVLAFVLPVSWGMKAKRVPRIHDITTDFNTPPQFIALAKDRPGRVAYGGAEVAAQQMKAYPGLETQVLPLPADQAFAKALDTARDMGWHIAAAVPAEGRIEATDSTFWFGFKDDVSIRITPAGARSLLDIRSASRVGVSDVGTNAQRIHTFLQRFTGARPHPS